MLIIFVIILILIGAAVAISINSGFLAFYSNFSESENYHRAYYTSISALERGELVTKQQDPGYIGSGGYILWENTGTFLGSDCTFTGFSYLGSDSGKPSTIFRDINSRTNRIPAISGGNVEPMLATGDAFNYNIMDHENAEIFILYYNNHTGSTDNPYTKVSCRSGNTLSNKCKKSRPESITGEIRLPILLKEKFSGLNTNKASISVADVSPKDDSIVDWQIRGIFDSTTKVPFTIFSTQKADSSSIDKSHDTTFRESDINTPLKFSFGSSWDPIYKPDSRGYNVEPTIISQRESDIKDHYYSFSNIFQDNKFPKNEIRFSLLNILESEKSLFYPYLEYYISFGGEIVPDKYYTINAEGDYADYHVKTIIYKPTIKESILSNFTTIF